MHNSKVNLLRFFTFLMALSGLCVAADDPTDQAAPGRTTPIFTQDLVFSIPFYLNPNARPPERVYLYVSSDSGQTWKAYQSQPPGAAKFDFKTLEEGEYWFAVRTTQDRNQPKATTNPEKIVIVDKTKPELGVEAKLEPGGRLEVHWTASDPHLDSGSLSLRYRESADDSWHPVTLDAPPMQTASPTTARGQVPWVVSARGSSLEIEASISDHAGNRATHQQSIDLGDNDRRDPATATTTRPVDRITESPTTVPAPIRNANDEDPSQVMLWDRAKSPSTANKEEVKSPWRSSNSTTPRTTTLPASQTTTSSTGDEPLGTGGGGQNTTATSPAPYATPSVPADVQYTASARFELDYDVRDAGPSGIARVELWQTADQGRSWQAHSTDEDLTSPIHVELKDDGIYGFRLLIHNQNGQSAPAPATGDTPDLWIGLDRNQPSVRWIGAEVNGEASNGSLQIRWEASDENLSDTPIRILHAPTPEGPWSLWVGGVANTGTYVLPLDPTLPPTAYVRVEVTDKAANQAHDQSPQLVTLDAKKPQGIIRGFRPITRRPTPRTQR